MRVHQIGYLVKRLEKAAAAFEKLGFSRAGEAVYDEGRDVDILFLTKDGTTVELVSPKSGGSVVAALIKTYHNAPYHICYASGRFEEEMQALSGSGFTLIEPPAPAPALGGRQVCFFMSPQIGMVELLDEGGTGLCR